MFKLIHRYFRGRFERFYFKNHWHFVLDLSLTIIVICLLASLIVLYFYRPSFLSGLPGFGSLTPPTVDLNNPPLSAELVPAAGSLSLDDGLILKMNLKNNGAAAISDLKISLEASDGNFAIERIENFQNDANLAVDNRTVNLGKIPSGASRETEVKIYFSSKSAERIINWRAKSEYSFGGQILTNEISLPALKVNAELSLKDAAYYTSPQGDQLGIGPLPPLVGIPTNYWIFLEAQSDSDWKNLVVSARLPKGVELTDSRSLLAGDFNYNPETRQLIWKVPEFSGRAESYRLGFEIQLIPVAAQAGQVLPLLDGPQYYATDALTGQEKSGSLDRLTTNLDKDRFNSGQGKVVSE